MAISGLSGKRVLVTGGGGFIGAHLTRRLVALGAEVAVCQINGIVVPIIDRPSHTI